jgi:hypothetical protein
MGAIGAGLYSIGIPKDSVVNYETAIKSDKFLVLAHGTADEVAKAKDIMQTARPAEVCTAHRCWWETRRGRCEIMLR